MDIFQWPTEVLEILAYLSNRGAWIRMGTLAAGIALIAFGIITMVKGAIPGVVGGVVKGVLK